MRRRARRKKQIRKGHQLAIRLSTMVIAAGIFLISFPLVVVVVSGTLGKTADGLGMDLQKINGIRPIDKVEIPEKIKVWTRDNQKVITVNFEEYVAQVVASEMPATFEIEALKAQSVAARTFAMAKINGQKKSLSKAHPKAPVCDSTHCQVYMTVEELFDSHPEGWGNSKEGWLKIQKACKATQGQVIYYDGKMITQPLFFSSSGGQTENSEDVFVSAQPYLVSVNSPYEEDATHKNEQNTMTIKQFSKKIKKAFPEKDFGDIKSGSIKVISRTAGGRVNEMQIGDIKLKGTDVRNALGLSSAMFSISFEEGTGWNGNHESRTKIVFTSNGSGHGVGMSQYGANGMAKEGYDYKQILKHYYSGTEIG